MGQTEPIVCRYETPAPEQREGRKKVVVRMASTETIKTFVQCVAAQGGETNLHAHPNTDGFWFVLTGRSRWYGDGDEPIAELGPNDGILIPRGTKYWFEAAGDDPLEVLHVAVTNEGIDPRTDRIDYAPARTSVLPSLAIDAERPQLDA